MKSAYPVPGMFAYPLPPGAYPLFDGASPHYFYGFMPPSEGSSQPLFHFPPSPGGYAYGDGGSAGASSDVAATFERLALNPSAPEYVPAGQWSPRPRGGSGGSAGASQPPTPPQDRPRSSKAPPPARPGKGFFSSGRVESAPSWRSRAASGQQPQQQRAPEARPHRAVNKGNSSNVRRTIYITDVDQQATEEQLALFFGECGEVVDCRVCGDPNSAMRFAFIEFSSEAGAEAALKMNGAVLGDFPLRVLPSKTAIVPVNGQYLPRNAKEREQCGRTVYAANIDKRVEREAVRLFFETLCGPVNKIRLLGDWQHTTRIAFVEFVRAESARTALACSGALLGSLPVRVSPSKTPVRDEPPAAGTTAAAAHREQPAREKEREKENLPNAQKVQPPAATAAAS